MVQIKQRCTEKGTTVPVSNRHDMKE